LNGINIAPWFVINIWLPVIIYYISINIMWYKVCQWLATGRWFSPGPPVSSNNKTDRYDITEILLKVDLNNKPMEPPRNDTSIILLISVIICLCLVQFTDWWIGKLFRTLLLVLSLLLILRIVFRKFSFSEKTNK
jgi:hypothetical protein